MGCKLRNCKFYIDMKSFSIILSISIVYDQLLKFQYLDSYKVVITTIFLIGILLLRIEKNILILMQTTFFILIVMIFSESLIGAFIVNALNINANTAHANKTILICIDILVYSTSILIVNKKKLLTKIINNLYTIYFKDKITNSIFFIAIFIILIVTYILAYKSFNVDTFYIILLISIICLILTVTFFYKNHMLKLKEKNFNELSLYTNIIEGLVDDVSKFKHDYNNVLFMIKGYLEEDNVDKLKNFLNTKICVGYTYNEIPKLKKIKDAGLRGLIASKIAQIDSKTVNVSIDILDTIDCFNIDMVDLCRIIGILIDNAYEAAQESNDKFMSISFSQDESLNIIIANSYNTDKNINISDIYKKNYSTKGKNRGIGLKNVKEIINKKYPNILLNTYVQKDMFIQDLYIEAK